LSGRRSGCHHGRCVRGQLKSATRRSTPDLVELLKQPTCFGPARRVILDQLENRFRQKFADHWAFIRYAQEQNLGLDFTSPPKRPDFLLHANEK
jgi:hypothetical protein